MLVVEVAVVIATVAAAVAVAVIPMAISGIPCILSIPNLAFIFFFKSKSWIPKNELRNLCYAHDDSMKTVVASSLMENKSRR